MKKFFSVMLLAIAIVFVGSQEKVSAEEEYYVGTFKDGHAAYMVLRTWELANPKTLNFKGAVRAVKGNNSFLIWYEYWFDGQNTYYKNSQGFSGVIDQYQTPIAYEIYRVNLIILAHAMGK